MLRCPLHVDRCSPSSPPVLTIIDHHQPRSCDQTFFGGANRFLLSLPLFRSWRTQLTPAGFPAAVLAADLSPQGLDGLTVDTPHPRGSLVRDTLSPESMIAFVTSGPIVEQISSSPHLFDLRVLPPSDVLPHGSTDITSLPATFVGLLLDWLCCSSVLRHSLSPELPTAVLGASVTCSLTLFQCWCRR